MEKNPNNLNYIHMSLPIRRVDTEEYSLVLLDGDFKFHYFDEYGTYNGWSVGEEAWKKLKIDETI